MRTVKIIECRKDMDKLREMLDARSKYGCSDENTTEEGVFIAPNVGNEFARLKWIVFDNRAHEGYLEDFDTLDGALSYATDGHTCCDRQGDWDVDGMFHEELSQRCRWFGEAPDGLVDVGVGSESFKEAMEKTKKGWEEDEDKMFKKLQAKEGNARKVDPFVTSMDEDTDKDDLVKGFVNSVLDNVNDVHRVVFDTYNESKLIRVVFNNTVGQTVAVDGILEKLNMLDWRMVCDKFCEELLRLRGRDPDAHDWPTPKAVVMKAADPDENDIVTKVTLLWKTDAATWDALSKCYEEHKAFHEREKSKAPDADEEIVELCPHCDHEARIFMDAEKAGYKAFCPNCGKTLRLCDACHQDGKDDHCDKCNKEDKEDNKEKEEADGENNEWSVGRLRISEVHCNHCEESSTINWDTRDGYTAHCPKCGAPVKVCGLCEADEKAEKGKSTCTRNNDGVCFRERE